MLRIAAITIALTLTFPAVARADAGSVMDQPISPGTFWRAWNVDLLILLNLGLLGFVYLRGIRQLWGKAGAGRGVGRGQAAAFVTSLGVLILALISPLHALSEELASA